MRAMEIFTAINADDISEGSLVYGFDMANDIEYIISDTYHNPVKPDMRPYMKGRIETIRPSIEDKRFQINGVKFRYAMIAREER